MSSDEVGEEGFGKEEEGDEERAVVREEGARRDEGTQLDGIWEMIKTLRDPLGRKLAMKKEDEGQAGRDGGWSDELLGFFLPS